jgi:hypothetical protein
LRFTGFFFVWMYLSSFNVSDIVSKCFFLAIFCRTVYVHATLHMPSVGMFTTGLY